MGSAILSLKDFVRESNKIEGIRRVPRYVEIAAHEELLALSVITVGDMEAFVSSIQPGAVLRRRVGLNVRVGNHFPPPGGLQIENDLTNLLERALDADAHQPFEIHQWYETLHPFTDGNGRSGRALWLWMMDRQGSLDRAIELGFLHAWYYQSLAADRAA